MAIWGGVIGGVGIHYALKYSEESDPLVSTTYFNTTSGTSYQSVRAGCGAGSHPPLPIWLLALGIGTAGGMLLNMAGLLLYGLTDNERWAKSPSTLYGIFSFAWAVVGTVAMVQCVSCHGVAFELWVVSLVLLIFTWVSSLSAMSYVKKE